MTEETPTVSTPDLAETLGMRVESLRGWRHRGLTPRAGRRWDLTAGLRAVLIHRLSEHFAPLEVAAGVAEGVSSLIYDDVNEGRSGNGVVSIVSYPSGSRGIYVGGASATGGAWNSVLRHLQDELTRHGLSKVVILDIRHDLRLLAGLFLYKSECCDSEEDDNE